MSALAMGGGGGGGSMPSETAPQYDPAVEYRAGLTALQAQRWADAEKSFRHVLAVSPRDANTNYLMALSKIGRSDYKGARSYLEKAVKLEPAMIPAHEQLGIALAKLGEADKAKEQLDWFTARATTCGTACADATVLQQGAAAVQAAIGAGKQARVAVPGLLMFASTQAGDGAYLAAVALINEHRYNDAILSLRAAEQVFGPHPDILTYLGFANRKLKRYDIAEAYYRRALAVAPGHRGATEYYGEMMLERGDVAGATRMLAQLDAQCTFGCAEADELRRWIVRRSNAS
ncbi:tetratricopeptide repeat protein [Novosphingobium lentum]|uniref:tetratricopeptide repeat protein n=1 Tax=Novosphingobium lentum TaxID=145287 RepID=UPI000829D5F9|nr:tetratricopeptide repeat protein [Novosphingobium lentum]